ncbi:hypothetical protein E5K00_03000 [Hymenobacter aquaticus]|uniref:GTPase n=1 Tax=Hymenobacter aquaticus TaxID=1867101 RepID=A0A4Z0Q2F8_9BACT|nr:hypothetical protein [Hymenobacter aquaticus]TGE24197.1 hypothetical protein E5K00_03000 [Hymenobacter aquaticus]
MPQLVFVYNADTGLVNSVLDLAHKLLSPATYSCALCAVTHGTRVRPEWKAFVGSLPVAARFLHRDEFRAAFPARTQEVLPAVFFQDDAGRLHSFITAAELNKADLLGLMALVEQRLGAAGPGLGQPLPSA